MKSRIAYLSGAALMLLGALGLAGCGGGGGSAGASARATIVLANDSVGAGLSALRGDSNSGSVPLADIQSLMVTITAVTLQQCGESDNEHGADEQEDVQVSDFAFDPTCLTIEQGGTVRWEWDTETFHTITSGSPGDVDAGALFNESGAGIDHVVELVFADLGVYPYFSNPDQDVEAGMAGTVKVVADDDEDEPGDDDHTGGDDGSDVEDGAPITVYEGAFDVDLLDLTSLSQVLTSADIPAGRYCRIILEIGDPQLVLVADPATAIMNIHLTANGRLFIKDRFEIEAGDEVIIVLNFGGIHLVPRGDGGYVLTPQVHAEVNPGEQETEIEGEITSINLDTQIIEVVGGDDGEGGAFEVVLSGETIIKTDDDSDDEFDVRTEDGGDMLLTSADLQVGQHVEVEGTLSEGGQVLAHEIEIKDEDFVTPPAV